MKKGINFNVVEKRDLKSIFRNLFKFILNDTVNFSILLLKKNKKYRFDKSKYVGLNLGSSTDNPPRWIGISGGIAIFFVNLPALFLRIAFSFSGRRKKQSFREFYLQVKNTRVLHYNLFYGIPFRDDCIPNIFSSHFFEHLSYESSVFLLTESYRVLEPGGVIRILVPSLNDQVQKIEEAVSAFHKGDRKLIQSFVTEPYTEFMDSFSRHRYMYTIDTLKKIIEDAGFVEVKERKEGEGLLPDLALLEKRKSIIVEAIKPMKEEK